MIEKRRIKYYITNTRVQLKFLYTNFIVLVPIAALYFHLEDRNKCKNRSKPDTNVGVRPDAKTEFNRTVKRS